MLDYLYNENFILRIFVLEFYLGVMAGKRIFSPLPSPFKCASFVPELRKNGAILWVLCDLWKAATGPVCLMFSLSWYFF